MMDRREAEEMRAEVELDDDALEWKRSSLLTRLSYKYFPVPLRLVKMYEDNGWTKFEPYMKFQSPAFGSGFWVWMKRDKS